MRSRARALLVATCLLPRAAASAQDTRTVLEPRVPPACATLTARLATSATALAPADESRLDTDRIQEALDGCPPGSAVRLRTDGDRSAFLSGALELRRGVTLVVEHGAVLFASRDPRVFEARPGSCGIVTTASERGCRPLVHAAVSDAGVMGDGVIDGRGGAPLLGRTDSWWDLAEQARAGDRHQQVPRLIVAEHADNFTLYRVTLRNAANFHVSYGGNGLTVWGVAIDTPRSARNTDGIDPISATNVSIVHSFIRTGDDSIAIKAGDGGPSSHITVAHNHFYGGHGMSIGSETSGGVSAVRVTDLSIDGADNGIRIKSNVSRGGAVSDIAYQDVCIRETKNPIVFDGEYTPLGPERDRRPTLRGIVLRGVHVIGRGAVVIRGFDGDGGAGLRFENVVFDAAPAACRAAFVAMRPSG